MKVFSLNIITLAALGAISMSSCINSQEAYEKAKLSGFVAEQTKDILAKNPPKFVFCIYFRSSLHLYRGVYSAWDPRLRGGEGIKNMWLEGKKM